MVNLKHSLLFILLIGVGSGCTPSVPTPLPHRPELDPYITFLQTQKQSPVDYLLGLFDRFNIVIISERAHPEITQYDLYYQLVSDKRFIDEVSSIFMEVGTSTLQPEMDELMLSKTDFSSTEVEKRIAYIGQNIGYEVYWEKTNYYDFIRKLYYLNRTLPEDKKIRVYPSNVAFSWEGMTQTKYQDFLTNVVDPSRDKIMADQIIANFNRLVRSNEKRKKALVIMNNRHGFNNAVPPDGIKGDNTGRYIMDQFPQITANVMMNTIALLPETTDNAVFTTPIQDGKWDAAFAALSNPNLGFDFKDTPFGQDSFDLFPYAPWDQMKYQDMFTGFVFNKPLKDHVFLVGEPGLYTQDEYNLIFLPRMQIGSSYLQLDGSEMAKYFEFANMNTIQPLPFDWLYQNLSKIDAWLQVNNDPQK